VPWCSNWDAAAATTQGEMSASCDYVCGMCGKSDALIAVIDNSQFSRKTEIWGSNNDDRACLVQVRCQAEGCTHSWKEEYRN
jgi:hypothetical protein